jgi:hypothetical protein
MNDEQNIYNVLERIELLLEAIRGELEIARIDPGRGDRPGY